MKITTKSILLLQFVYIPNINETKPIIPFIINSLTYPSGASKTPIKSNSINAIYPYFSNFIYEKYLSSGIIAPKTFDPSNGGTGIKLKDPRPIFISAKYCKKYICYMIYFLNIHWILL